MAAAKTPVAIRITRPYQTEDEFLAHELDTISRTGVTLVGAQARPEGAVLRFELTLSSGAPLLRGEGRVVGYREAAPGREPGLSLRFTRLDSKSKALVDRVGAMRDAKRSVPPPLPAGARRSAVPPPAPSSSGREVPPLPTSSSDVVAAAAHAPVPVSVSASAAVSVSDPAAVSGSAAVSDVSASAIGAPADREGALDRLRKRRLDPGAVARILSEGSQRRSR